VRLPRLWAYGLSIYSQHTLGCFHLSPTFVASQSSIYNPKIAANKPSIRNQKLASPKPNNPITILLAKPRTHRLSNSQINRQPPNSSNHTHRKQTQSNTKQCPNPTQPSSQPPPPSPPTAATPSIPKATSTSPPTPSSTAPPPSSTTASGLVFGLESWKESGGGNLLEGGWG
jgi:hypothetical protein